MRTHTIFYRIEYNYKFINTVTYKLLKVVKV